MTLKNDVHVYIIGAGFAGQKLAEELTQKKIFGRVMAFLDDDTDLIEEVLQFFVKNMDLMHNTYPASAKYILQKRGLGITQVCRNGSLVENQQDYDNLDVLLEEFEELAMKIHLKH